MARFPKLGEGILNNLDDENLAKCHEVKRSWHHFMDGEKFYWQRVIKKYIDGIEEFKESWKLVMEKTNVEMIKELGIAVKHFLKYHPSECKKENCNHRLIPYSPLHIAAESGQYLLSLFIIEKVEDKNPKALVDGGHTPLHEAAQLGHLEICQMIMDKLEDKNPTNDD